VAGQGLILSWILPGGPLFSSVRFYLENSSLAFFFLGTNNKTKHFMGPIFLIAPAWLKKHQFCPQVYWTKSPELGGARKIKDQALGYSRLRAQNFPTVLFFLRRKFQDTKKVKQNFAFLAYISSLGARKAKLKSLPSRDFL